MHSSLLLQLVDHSLNWTAPLWLNACLFYNSLMSPGMTGPNTSAPLGRNTTTTAGQRCPSGRSPKTGWRGNCVSVTGLGPSLPKSTKRLWINEIRIHEHVPSVLMSLCFAPCPTESRGKKSPRRLRLSTLSPKTGTTDGRPCKPRRPLVLLVLVSSSWLCFYPFFCFAELEQSLWLIGWSTMIVVKLICSWCMLTNCLPKEWD